MLHQIVAIFALLAPYSCTPCCHTQVVSNAGELDGVYVLKKDLLNKPDPLCIDGCIYVNEKNMTEQFCFRFVSEFEGAEIQCMQMHTSTPAFYTSTMSTTTITSSSSNTISSMAFTLVTTTTSTPTTTASKFTISTT